MDYTEMGGMGALPHCPYFSHFAAGQGEDAAVYPAPVLSLHRLIQTCQLLSTCPLPPQTPHLLASVGVPQEARYPNPASSLSPLRYLLTPQNWSGLPSPPLASCFWTAKSPMIADTHSPCHLLPVHQSSLQAPENHFLKTALGSTVRAEHPGCCRSVPGRC